MTTPDPLGLAFGAASEAQGRSGVRTDEDAGELASHGSLGLEAIAAVHEAALQIPIVAEPQGRDLGLDGQVLLYEVENDVGELSGVLGGPLDLDEEARVGNLQQDLLPVGRIQRVEDADGGTGFEGADVSDDEIDTIMVSCEKTKTRVSL